MKKAFATVLTLLILAAPAALANSRTVVFDRVFTHLFGVCILDHCDDEGRPFLRQIVRYVDVDRSGNFSEGDTVRYRTFRKID